MTMLSRLLAAVALMTAGLCWPHLVLAETSGPISISSGLSYEFLAKWDVDRLNKILKTDTPAFAGVTVAYTPARTAVNLYRVTYGSVIPERGNKPTTTTGLLAIPEGATGSLPLVSYQHGTVYLKQQVPSFPEQSPETQLMIAQFAAQGYALIGADYFGLGLSDEPEGYMVKASHQQASYDMLVASRAVLEHLGVETPKLLLAGWSQGGFVTMAFLEKLEASGVSVAGAATASAPLDVYAALSGFLDFPRKGDANWVNTLFILSSFAFENYYGVPGLAHALIADEYYDVSRRAYQRLPIDASDIPTDLHKLLRPEYFDAQYFANSAYGRLIAQTQAYRWVVRSNVRNYYGETDEAISVGIGRIGMTYAQAIGNGNPKVEAISTGPTSHRGTFATATPQWKVWFDTLAAR